MDTQTTIKYGNRKCKVMSEGSMGGRESRQRNEYEYSGSYFLSYYTASDHKKHLNKIAKAKKPEVEVENLD